MTRIPHPSQVPKLLSKIFNKFGMLARFLVSSDSLDTLLQIAAYTHRRHVPSIQIEMNFQRHTFNHDSLTLSYLDTGSSPASINRPPLLCLHAHLMQGATYTGLAEAVSRPTTASLLLTSADTATPATPPLTPAKITLATSRHFLHCLTCPRPCSSATHSAVSMPTSSPPATPIASAPSSSKTSAPWSPTTSASSFPGRVSSPRAKNSKQRIGARFLPYFRRLLPPFRGWMASRLRSAGHGPVTAEPGRRPLV